jgi:hypothetical protein
MAGRIITKGLRTGIGIGGVRYILLRGLVSDDNPPDPSESRLIIIAIINQLKRISISSGFFTDAGSCVDDWRFTDIPTSDLPCIAVQDESEDIERKGQFDHRTLNVEVIGWITIDDMNDVRNFQQDIETAMTNGGGPTYPDSVYLSRMIGRPEMTPDQKDKKIAKITLSYEVEYRTRVV